MTWTVLTFPFGSVLTSAKMTQLYDNETAQANGDSGAPKNQTASYATASVGQAAIGASAVGQSELKSTTASQSLAMPAAVGYYSITLTGATYTMGWFLGSTVTNDNIDLVGPAHTGAYATVVGFRKVVGTAQTAYLYSRYVQASPPWNLGYGDIALFAMVMLDKTTKEIISTYVAKDPPWAYHGAHNLHPVDGKLLKAAGLWGVDIGNELKGVSRDESLTKIVSMLNIQKDPVQLKAAMDYDFTMAEKNIDMDSVPHLFSREYDPTKHVIALLDPCSGVTDCFSELQDTDVSAGLANMLTNDYIEIGTKELSVSRNPLGVISLPYNWKNTL